MEIKGKMIDNGCKDKFVYKYGVICVLVRCKWGV